MALLHHYTQQIETMWQILVSLAVLLASSSSVLGYDSDYSLNKAERYVKLCGAAYCTDPKLRKNSVDDWSCNVCASFPNMTAKSFKSSKNDGNGFVGYDGDANEIIVSFSGTDPLSIRDWMDDLNFFKTAYPYCSGCEVHEGFYNTYLSVQNDVKSYVSSFQAQHPTATLAITGHSLGAAMAAHCAAEYTHMGQKISTLYSFGMPRVGDEAFENWYKSVVIGTFRVVHHKDPVPHLAPESFGFHHMPYEVFYTSDYNDWKLCSFEGEDNTCSDQYAADLNVDNHLRYLDFDFTTNYLSCGL